MNLSIIPECYVDTNLVETIVPPLKEHGRQGYNHQKGCGTVTRVMQENFKGQFALGIIDKDKQIVSYLKQFYIVTKIGSLLLHKHKTEHHYIIQITPGIEQMILNNAVSINLRLENFDLPPDLEALKKQSKQETSKRDTRFKNLFKEMLKNNANDIVKLAGWIKYLRDHNYNSDLRFIQKL